MYICKYCNKDFNLQQARTNHEKYCKLNPIIIEKKLEQKRKKLEHERKKKEQKHICNTCNREFILKSSKSNHEKYCDGSGLTKKEKIIKKQKTSQYNGSSFPKGKTFEEVFGEKRAKEIKKKLSESLKKIHGSPLTEEGKKIKNEKIRQNMLERYRNGWEAKGGTTKKIKYNSPIAGQVTLDGKWELAVAKYLDKENIKWTRNKVRFEYINLKNKISTYCPDFYLVDENYYLEIKGYETDLDRCKWKQFKYNLKVWKRDDLKKLNIL